MWQSRQPKQNYIITEFIYKCFNTINNKIVKVINFPIEYHVNKRFRFNKIYAKSYIILMCWLIAATIMSWGGCDVEGWRSVVERGVKTKAYATNPTTLNSFWILLNIWIHLNSWFFSFFSQLYIFYIRKSYLRVSLPE